jgi:hypothetical protein
MLTEREQPRTGTSYRDAAIALWGEAGTYIHESYARHLPLFPQLPQQLPIVCGITSYGHCIGLTRSSWQHGPRITIASNLFKQGTGQIDNTMIHEMLHAWLHTTGHDTAHDSPDWYDAIRRLSPAVLGHEVDITYTPSGSRRKSVRVPNPRAGEPEQPKTIVRKVPRDDLDTDHAKVAGWPRTFRPADYPRGRIIDCPSY